jgi:predicted O-methyltransferase YrrM
MDGITRNYIRDYIMKNLNPSGGVIRDMELYAEENHIPIIQPEVAQLLKVLVKGFESKKILEIGTAIGYSAVILAEAAGKDAEVVSLEINKDMARKARLNIERVGLNDRIEVIQGDARFVLNKIEGKFDFVFIDAAKGHYGEMFENVLQNIRPGGIIVCDNVLFRGMVASDSLVKRRKITIVKRMRKFLKYITQHQQLDTAIVPIGDGVSISCIRRTEHE